MIIITIIIIIIIIFNNLFFSRLINSFIVSFYSKIYRLVNTKYISLPIFVWWGTDLLIKPLKASARVDEMPKAKNAKGASHKQYWFLFLKNYFIISAFESILAISTTISLNIYLEGYFNSLKNNVNNCYRYGYFFAALLIASILWYQSKRW